MSISGLLRLTTYDGSIVCIAVAHIVAMRRVKGDGDTWTEIVYSVGSQSLTARVDHGLADFEAAVQYWRESMGWS